jgi:threonine dehydrogenase-like Zn-dependent dehydrogenase
MPDITVEVAGYPETLNASFRLVRKYGTVVMFGIQEGRRELGGSTPIDTGYLLLNEPTVIPCAGTGSGNPMGHVREMVDLKARGWWDPAVLVTHRMRFDEVDRAYRMYDDREDGIIKVVMEP